VSLDRSLHKADQEAFRRILQISTNSLLLSSWKVLQTKATSGWA